MPVDVAPGCSLIAHGDCRVIPADAYERHQRKFTVGKILRLLIGYVMLCALFACVGSLLLPRLRLAAGIALAVCAVPIVAWWLVFVRSHQPAAWEPGDRADGLSDEESRDAAEDPQVVYWVDRLRRGKGPG
jgi:hypothetical protein